MTTYIMIDESDVDEGDVLAYFGDEDEDAEALRAETVDRAVEAALDLEGCGLIRSEADRAVELERVVARDVAWAALTDLERAEARRRLGWSVAGLSDSDPHPVDDGWPEPPAELIAEVRALARGHEGL